MKLRILAVALVAPLVLAAATATASVDRSATVQKNTLTVWLQTDAQGRVRAQAPSPGRWVLRGTDLRLSATRPDAWESRFVTLAFEVGDGPD